MNPASNVSGTDDSDRELCASLEHRAYPLIGETLDFPLPDPFLPPVLRGPLWMGCNEE